MSDQQLSFLRAAALLSWYYQCPKARAEREKTEEERRGRIARFRDALTKIFGDKCEINISINGGCIEAAIEDLRLVAYEFTMPLTQEPRTMVSLLGRCASCGVETLSEPADDLAGLGKILEKFEPIREHGCKARPQTGMNKSKKSRT